MVFFASLFASNSTFWPYRIQTFSELALLETREVLSEVGISPQISLLSLQIEQTILEFILQHGYLGSIIVVQNGQTIFAQGFGKSRPGAVNEPHTTHRWESITKLFTAVAMLQLSEMGLVDLDVSITTYLPEYANPVLYPGFAGTPVVSIRSLLAMKSGIADFPDEGKNWLDRPPNITDIANYVAVLPRSNIGQWNYINSGFSICALILGRIVDSSRNPSLVYQEFLQENIFTPAGMSTAFAPYFVAQDITDAQGHTYDQEGNLQAIGINFFPSYTSMRVGTGNINGSVLDFQKFTVALNGGSLISQANLTMMLDQYLGGWVPPTDPHYANGHYFMEKDGGLPGQWSYYMRFENNTMIFITANVDPRGLNSSAGVNPKDTIEYLGLQIGELLFPNPP
ncbi:MAG: serine hydrolase domain-containing protein [Candidatus Thorarchaeota archaeon]